ncbi:DUF5807 family protein [Halovivax gelatinilyticus]|uniref:DUF5807 family protein n=1 Tax=Halovivax gelatinilyticus TaxID=2961597 RepID=UPI0020CA4A71|nr:DUF5807 family protein [Halovivax gelatinilyticus]
MTADHEAFLAGERPDDVAIYLAADAVDDLGRLESYGERVDDGIVIVVDGERGRNAFRAATGVDAMAFAKEAMATQGSIDAKLTGGTCPEADGDHEVRFVFAFAEEQNEDVGGLYGEGDVVHAYARCDCDLAYSDKWVVGDR